MPTAIEALFLFAVIWCLFWALVASRSRAFLISLTVLGAVQWVLSSKGFYTNETSFPPPQMLVFAPVLIALLATVINKPGRNWLSNLDPVALMMIHVARIPVELTLHEGYVQGLVPQGMTYCGFNFDILSGISAAFMVAWMLGKSPPRRNVQLAWNIACLALLLVVVITAVLSLPSSIQRVNFDRPNVLVMATPYILLPALIVPLVLWAHVASLLRLVGKHQR
ncbi:MAG: hypothetical protein IPP33_05155 [Flavobacteriales bacterium]|nr:hypothetical protein [Flavobacteriales bacterium]